jgi:hypothetical protein
VSTVFRLAEIVQVPYPPPGADVDVQRAPPPCGPPATPDRPRTIYPSPAKVVLEERWANGEWFRSGAVWQVGKGRVFYFRPGHETFAVSKEKPILQILKNAVRWLAGRA